MDPLIEFVLVFLVMLMILSVNLCHLIYLIKFKEALHRSLFSMALANFSISSLIIGFFLVPFYYFRYFYASASDLWRFWTFLYHLCDGVQRFSLLLLVTNTNNLPNSFERLFILLSWLAPAVTYSPLLWWSANFEIIDYAPYRRLSFGVPRWILFVIYSCMYLIPVCLSILVTATVSFYSLFDRYFRSKFTQASQEHRRNMAELTNLVDTVLNFELDSRKIDRFHVRTNDQVKIDRFSFLLYSFSFSVVASNTQDE